MKIAVIPARGGSKRIPRKNIRDFAGKPVIGYSIAAARDSGLFDRIVVSTDDDEIAAVAERLGAEAPFRRPAGLSCDHTGVHEVVKHAIAWMNREGPGVDYACCIYATAPFVSAAQLRLGYDKLAASGKPYLLPVASFPFPIQRAYRINAAGMVEAFHPEHIRTRSQDLEPAFHDAALFYWGRAQAFLEDVVALQGNAVPLLVSRHEVQDIDTQEDWRHAERMYAATRLEERP